uniref:BRCT domain-containing protein n=1 Tax=Cyprinodon variegatus TaxID=28743 RepID=A0A3Q2FHI3_CYPVA
MVPLKRRKMVHAGSLNTETNVCGGTEPTKFPQLVLFLLERKMGASRRAFLSQLGRRKGFQVDDLFSENVTHVICENNSGEEVRMWLEAQQRRQGELHLLDVSWYTESMRHGFPVEIHHRHKIQVGWRETVEGRESGPGGLPHQSVRLRSPGLDRIQGEHHHRPLRSVQSANHSFILYSSQSIK